MHFTAKMQYLVDTHQAKDFKDARAKLCRPKTPPPPVKKDLWYADN